MHPRERATIEDAPSRASFKGSPEAAVALLQPERLVAPGGGIDSKLESSRRLIATLAVEGPEWALLAAPSFDRPSNFTFTCAMLVT